MYHDGRRHTDDPRFDGEYRIERTWDAEREVAPVGGRGCAFAQSANKPVSMHPVDKKYGVAITGGQGSGKTSVLTHMIADDVHDPDCAVVVFDPKSDLYRKVLSITPTWRRVWVLDMGAPAFGMNFLSAHHNVHTAADLVVKALRSLNPDNAIQASSDRFLRQGVIAASVLARSEGRMPRFIDVYRILQPTSHGLRRRVADLCKRAPERNVQLAAEFFGKSLPADLEGSEAQTVAKLDAPRNKIERLIGDPRLDYILGHPVQVSMLDILRKRDVLVVRGNIGEMGWDNVTVAFTLLMGMLHAAMSRQQDELAPEERCRVSLTIDEAHMMIDELFADMVAVHRSAGLEVKAALQYTAQIIDEKALGAWKSLLQHRIAFRARDPEDARIVSDLMMNSYADVIRGDQESRDIFRYTPDHVLNIADHHGIAAMICEGRPQAAFPVQSIPAGENPAMIAYHLAAQQERGCMVPAAYSTDQDPVVVSEEAGRAAGTIDPGKLLADDDDEGAIGAVEQQAAQAPNRPLAAADAADSYQPQAALSPQAGEEVGLDDDYGVNGLQADLDALTRAVPRYRDAGHDDAAQAPNRPTGGPEAGEPAESPDAPVTVDAEQLAAMVDDGEVGALLGQGVSPLYAELHVDVKRDLSSEPTNAFDADFEVTDEHCHILHRIFEAKAMYASQVGQFIYGHADNPTDRARRELNRMVRAGYLRVQRAQRTSGKGRMPGAYIVTLEAQERLQTTRRPGSDRPWISEHQRVGRVGIEDAQHLVHDLRAVGWMLAVTHYCSADKARGDRLVADWYGIKSLRAGDYRIRRTRPTAARSRAKEMRSLDQIELPAGFTITDLELETFEDVIPDGIVEFVLRRGKHRFTVDALVEMDQTRRPNSQYMREKFHKYDALITAWWRGVRRHQNTGEPPWVFFVCDGGDRARACAEAADKAFTGTLGRLDTRTIDERYPARERAFFVSELDAYQGTLRGYMLPRHPPKARAQLHLGKGCELRQAQLIARSDLSRISYG